MTVDRAVHQLHINPESSLGFRHTRYYIDEERCQSRTLQLYQLYSPIVFNVSDSKKNASYSPYISQLTIILIAVDPRDK